MLGQELIFERQQLEFQDRLANLIASVELQMNSPASLSGAEGSLAERKAGGASQLVSYAQAALENMRAANRDNDDNPHANEGIRNLRAAIAEGKKGHTRLATSHAQEALTHLEASIHG